MKPERSKYFWNRFEQKEIHINYLELLIQFAIILIAIYSVGVANRWWWAQRIPPCDFYVYYFASVWQNTPVFTGSYFIYSDLTRPIFRILTMWTPNDAYMYYSAFQTVCFMIAAHKVMKLQWGWVLVVINFYHLSTIVMDGNIHLSLTLACCYPLGGIFAAAIKPVNASIPILFWIAKNKTARKFGVWWFVIIAVIVVIFLPPSEGIKLAVSNTHGHFFTRPENLLYLINLYIIFGKEKICQKNQKY